MNSRKISKLITLFVLVVITLGTMWGQTFNYTGAVQTYVIPTTGNYSIQCWGAQGGSITSYYPISGALGGYATGTVFLTAGQNINIYVGGQGQDRLGNHPYGGCTVAPGGFNGGGNSLSAGNSTGGGGASDVRIGGTALVNRIIVAGGGGGCGWAYAAGGAGGGLSGNNGLGDNLGWNYANPSLGGAQGGSQVAGGAAGASGGGCGKTAGSLGQGGNGSGSSAGGGGGGGGYYGGGGGGYADGGGGGSSYLGGVSSGSTTAGVKTGNGQVILTLLCTPTSITPNVASLPALTGQCSVAAPTAPTATDDCGTVITGTTTTTFPITTQGTTTVTWTYTSGAVTTTQTQTVTITDNTAPGLGAGTLGNPFTTTSSTYISTFPSGIYYFNIAGNLFQATVDNSTAGGGWILVLNYVHQGGTNPALQVRTTNLPIQTGAVLGADESGTAAWGHASNSLMNAINPTQLRFYGQTSNHGRVINFTTNYTNVLNYSKTGTGSFSGINNPANYTLLAGHTANIPQNAPDFFTNQGDLAMTEFPFWLSGTYHWGIKGFGIRWEVDDFPGNANFNTIHRIWGKNTNPPTIQTNLPNFTAQCSATPSAPTVTDNCGATITGTTATAFPITTQGTTVVTWTYTDAAGNSSTQNQNVVIADVTPPTISCPANITTVASGPSGAAVTFSLPAVADNCGTPTLTQTAGLASGSTFPIGTTTNSFLVTDAVGLTSTCSFTVTVSGAAPSIVCPSNITTNNAAGLCGANVTYTATETTGIPASTITYSPASGSFFPVGTTVVTATATNVIGTSTCTFNVTVNDTEAPNITCQNINVPLDASGNGSFTPSGLLSASSDNCGIATIIATNSPSTVGQAGFFTHNSSLGHGQSFTAPVNGELTSIQFKVNGNTSGNTIHFYNSGTGSGTPGSVGTPVYQETGVNYVDAAGGTTWTTVQLSTPLPVVAGNQYSFVLNGVSDIYYNGNAYPGGAFIWQYDTGSGCCTWGDIAFNATFNTYSNTINVDCADLGPSTYNVIATDVHGNTSNCNATVTVVDNISPTAVCTPFTATLDASGNVTITGANVDGGSTDNCSVASLSVSPNTFTCANLGANTVTLTVTDQSGNSSTCNTTVTVLDNINPTAVCAPYTAALDASGNVTITGANVDGGSTDNCTISSLTVSPNTFTCANLGANTVTLTVTDQSGNTSTCNTTVTVIDNVNPTVVCTPFTAALDASGNVSITAANVDGGTTDNCTIASLTVSPNTFTCANLGANTVTLTAVDQSGNTSTCTATVTVIDNINPTAVCSPYTAALDASGNVTITGANVDGGSTDNCTVASLSVSPNSFNCANLGANTVTLTVTDQSGNSSTCTATVTVVDNINPTAVCAPYTATLDASGNVTITGANVDGGSTDNCTVASLSVSPNTFTCTNLGANTVTLTVTDQSGNTSTCNTTVTVVDNINPTVICVPYTAVLDASGNISVTAANVDGGTTDNCTVASLTVSPNAFTCANLGANTVTLTAIDQSGNTSTCNTTVTVVDTLDPIFLTTPANINLFNVTGLCGRTVTYSAPTFTDNCSVTMAQTDGTGLTSGDVFPVGTTTQTYTLTDISGNTTTYSFTVTITDNENPVIANCPANITVAASASTCGNNVSWSSPVATDNCPAVNMTSTHNPGDFFPTGTTTVTYTATDAAGNVSTCVFTVTVNDNLAPVAPVLATVTGQCSASVTAPTATDNCAGTVTGTTTDPLTYTTEGTYTVTWSFNDGNGNTSTATQTVIVDDNIAPVAPVLATLTGECSATVVAPTATDNCAGVITGTTTDPLTYTAQGTYTVTWSFNDGNGNTSTATQTVIVDDVTAPVVPVLATVTAECSATVVAPTTTDNCTGVITGTTSDPLTYTAQGTYTVTWTFDDGNGNTSTATQTVVVDDITNPIANCQNFTVALNASGTASITANDINNGSSDNCGIASITASPTTFNCSNVGPNNVTLTVTDIAGNVSTCVAVVTVQDVTPLTWATTPSNVTVNAATSSCGATVNYVLPTYTDNCTVTMTQTDGTGLTSGSFFPIGTTTQTFTATNAAGEVISHSFTITVVDNQLPIISGCPANITLSALASSCGNTANWTVPTVTDNCVGVTLTSTHNPATFFPVGTTTVTYTATDAAGNVSTCVFTVTVNDNLAPVAPVLATVTGQCSATVTAPTATDNCAGTVTGTTTDPLTYTTEGTYTVTWTFNDGNGNTSTATQTVIVDDVTAPVAPVLATATGECSVTVVVPTATDNCAGVITGTTTDPLTYTAQGTYTVTWSFNDGNGNTSTATQTVIVDDVTAPVVPVLATVTGECSATVVAPTTTDNCAGVITGTTTNPLTYTAQGTYTVTWTFNDGNGNTSTATQTVVVDDVTNPIANCQNFTVALNASGTASITANDINNGSSDNCGIASITASPTTFNCSNVGPNNVTLTVTDIAGNVSTCVAVVTVQDVTPLTWATTPSNVTVNATPGFCGRTVNYVLPTYTDNCTVTMTQTDGTGFTSGDIFPIGTTTQTFTATNAAGEVITHTFTITVNDTQLPVISSCPANITVNSATTTCGTNVTWSAPTASDNCPGVVLTTTAAPGSFFPVGTTTVTYTATDNSGNTANCSFTVTVIDNVAPVVPVIATVTGECSASVTAPTTTDNCSGTLTGTTTDPLTYTTQGTYTVTWTFVDGAGNTTTANQTVIVDDITAPVTPVLANVTGECSATITTVPTATDNCSGTITGTTTDPLTYSTQGTFVVTWSFDDGNGNTSTTTQTVIVDDVTAPTVPVIADATGECSATATAPTTTDNCSGTITGTTTDPLTYTAQGSYVITWTFDDGNGNTSTATQNVIVNDVTAPTIVAAADTTVDANFFGCSALDLVLSSPVTNDNCQVVSVVNDAPNPLPFGPTTVTWTVTDINGNTASAQQIVTVTSNITGTIDTATCVSYLAPDGATYTNSGVYTATIPSFLGCDSVITINLTILNPTTSTINVSACGSYTAPDGQEYMASGMYTAVLTNSVGCDSIITINLDIHNLNLNVGIQQDGTELVAMETNATYQWYNCTNEAIVPGATEQTYVPVLTADYTVILSDGVCMDTTDCYTISLDVVIPEVFSPNGDGLNDVFEIIGIEDYPQNHVTVYNRWGQVVFDAAGYNNEWDGTNQSNGALGTNELPVGTYFYVIDLGPSNDIYVGHVYKGYIYLTR